MSNGTIQDILGDSGFNVFFTVTPQEGFAPLTVTIDNLSGETAALQDTLGDTNVIQDALEGQ